LCALKVENYVIRIMSKLLLIGIYLKHAIYHLSKKVIFFVLHRSPKEKNL